LEAEVNIYVASSWRNEARQQAAVATLRGAGHDVYDFRNPAPGDHGFGWRQCTDVPQPWSAGTMLEVLKNPAARDGFEKDMGALRDAEVTVLVLPCGRSAHLELGWAAGAGHLTYVVLDNPISEPELMYLMCTRICVSIEEVVADIIHTMCPF
jgi:hypothetical protein